MLLAAWMIAASPALVWMVQLRHNAALLAVGAVLLASRSKRTELSRGAVGLLLACAWMIAAAPLSSHLIVASACIVGSALLLGTRSAAAVAFCCCALPVDAQLDAFVGLPARLITARLVASFLSAFGVPSVTSEAVLQLESGLADVEIACSGVRSIWVGALVFFGMSALLRVQEDARWIAKGAAYAAALLLGNYARVLIIVTLGIVLKQPALADVIHVPLGHLVFALATAALLFTLKGRTHTVRATPRKARPLVAACIFAAFPAASAEQHASPLQAVVLPGFQQLALQDKERALFEAQGARASKWKFDQGTLVIVVSSSFRAHHAPEVCMAAMGHRIALHGAANGVVTYGIDDVHTGVYWFQSPTRSEPTLLGRALAGSNEPWALVSVVFDGAASAALLTQLSTATAVALEASRANPSL